MTLRKTLSNALLLAPNRVFRRALDWPGRPVFYDIDRVCPQLRSLERNYLSIKAELLKRHLPAIPAYHEVDRHQERIAKSPPGGSNWRVFFFEAMGRKVRLNRRLCPKTAALIDSVPKVFQACFSILEPKKSVPAHCGLYNGYLRYHLGIEVPRATPPSIRIKDQHYTWQEGESVLFDDTWSHEIKNECSEIRVVLIVDILRPMRGMAGMVNWAMFLVGHYTYALIVSRKAHGFSRMIRARPEDRRQ
jgi:aspartyl/asparaginyl beta-hydroxylase (cupin superfamily)